MAHRNRYNERNSYLDDKYTAGQSSLTRAEIEVHTLNTKLFQAIDTIGELERKYASELELVREENARLYVHNDTLKEAVQRLELEKEEMVVVVEDLIKRVQERNDYSFIEHSGRIHLSGPIDEMSSNIFHYRRSEGDDETSKASYARAIIRKLGNDLTVEQRSHERTKKVAENEIRSLRSKLERREAELEMYLTNRIRESADGNAPAESGRVHVNVSRPPHLDSSYASASPSEADQGVELDVTTTSQRETNAELERLRKELEEAKASQARAEALLKSPIRKKRTPQSRAFARAAARKMSPRSRRRKFSPKTQEAINNIERHVQDITQTMTDFSIDGGTTEQGHVLEKDAPAESEISPEFNRILLLEDECLRLQATVESTQRELIQSREEFERREWQLYRRIDELEATVTGHDAASPQTGGPRPVNGLSEHAANKDRRRQQHPGPAIAADSSLGLFVEMGTREFELEGDYSAIESSAEASTTPSPRMARAEIRPPSSATGSLPPYSQLQMAEAALEQAQQQLAMKNAELEKMQRRRGS